MHDRAESPHVSTTLPKTLSFLEFGNPPVLVERSSGTGMGSSVSSGASLTGGLSFPDNKRATPPS